MVTVKLELSLAAPYATPSWVDITASLDGTQRTPITITFGRQDEFADVAPSVMSCTLNNSDGRFTIGRTSGPYGTSIKNERRIRLSIIRNAVTTYVFDGHVANWPVEWVYGDPSYATCQVTATDRLKRFGEIGTLRSMVEEEILRNTLTTASPGTTSLINGQDADFEGGIGNWQNGNDLTLAATSEQAHSGSGAMRMTLGGAGGGTWAANTGSSFASAAAVTPGDVLSTGAWFRAAAAPVGADYARIIGFYTDTDEHYELTDPALTPAGRIAKVSVHWNIAGIAGRIAAIRAAHPGIKLYAYQDVAGMMAGPHSNNRPTSCVTQEQATAHGTGSDDWRLHKESDGTVVYFNDFPTVQAAHIGRASWRTAATQNFAGIKADGFDGVFFDDVNTYPGHGFNEGEANDSVEFLNDTTYGDAMVATMAVLAAAARSHGLAVVANVGMDPWTVAHYDRYLAMLNAGSLDGVCREFWVNWGSDTVYYDGSTWTDTMKVLTDAEARGAWAMVNTYALTTPNHTESIRYGLASFYLHWDGVSGSGFGYNDGQPVSSVSEYRTTIGTPVEAKQLISGTSTDGAWMRHYTGGVAIANAKSAVGNITFTLGGTYLDPSGTPVTSVVLAKTRGMVLTLPTGGTARTWRIVARYLNSANTYVTQTNGPAVAVDETSWAESRLEASTVPSSPSGVAKVVSQVETGNGTSAGEVHYCDDVWLIRHGAAGTQTTLAAAYYPLGEDSDAVSAANITAYAQGFAVARQRGSGGTLEWAGGTGPGADELGAPLFAPASADNGLYLDAELLTPVGGTAQTLLAFLRADTGTVSRVIAEAADASGNSILVGINSAGKLYARRLGQAGTVATATTTTTVNDNQTHSVAVVSTLSGSTATMAVSVDGVQRATVAYATSLLPTASQLSIGGRKANPSPGEYGLFAGTLSHVAAFGGVALTQSRIADIHNAGVNGLTGERTDQRVGRILDWRGIPTADRNLDTGDATVGAQHCNGHQPVECLQEVAHTEQGVLLVDGQGRFTFHRRSRRYNTTPAVTLTATSGQVAVPPSIPGDTFGLQNDVTVSWVGGQARSVNQASITEYGLYEAGGGVDTAAPSAAGAQSIAQWRVSNYGEPRVRIPDVTVDLATLDALAAGTSSIVTALVTAGLTAGAISTKLRLAGLPSTSAPSTSAEVFIEGGTMTIGPTTGQWTVAYNTSPADHSQVWALGTAGFSELGVTTKLGL